MNVADLLTTREVAALAGVSQQAVSKWADSGKLRVAHKLPTATGARLFHKDDVDALLAARSAA